ncbi:SusC/RagA family TonB-linked outer membrane protein [Chryseobacterium taichungense]|uniref:SusC/RagA family TonB-linked outer membrane protein n=1 Tax=Chryseobacterium taichungense TaxID=295069 RepID=UPI0028AA7C88|nr:SusC/RagA family TonB-linked outer membrane protein [Chryseobacterium taichungense]
MKSKDFRPSCSRQGTGSRPTYYRYTIATIVFVFAMLVTLQSIAQTLDIKANNKPLISVIKELRQQTRYAFVFNAEQVKKAKPVSVDLRSSSIEKVLDEIFKSQPFTYQIKDRTIYIIDKSNELKKEKPDKQKSISGRVTDSMGNPLSGVSILIPESDIGTFTDLKGNFSLSDVGAHTQVNFRLIGYQPFMGRITGERMDIVLSIQNKLLTTVDVTVNTGYQSIPKERATGSFVFIDSALINRRAGPNILERLEGVVPGLLFNKNTSASTSAPDISIRGRSTLFAGDQPLIVMDGFPYDGDLSNINPNDIENISILKDAAAASIWGVRSGNGVIVLTTKKGKINSQPLISFNSNVTIGQKSDIFYNRNYLSSKDMIEVEKFLFEKDFYSSSINDPNQVITPVIRSLYGNKNGLISDNGLHHILDSLGGLDIRRDIKKYYYRNPVLQQYSFSLSGGAEGYTYRYSVGHDKNDYELRGNNNRRTTLSLANTFSLFKNLELISNITLTHSNNTSNNTLSDLNSGAARNSIYSYAPLRDQNGNPARIERDYNGSFINSLSGSTKYKDWNYYPLDELANSDNTGRNLDMRLVLGLQYKIMEGLRLSLNYQYEKQLSDADNYYSDKTYYTRNLYNMFLDTVSGNEPVPKGGIFNSQHTRLISNRIRGLLNYAKNISDRHDVNVLLGAELSDARTKSSANTAYGYDKNTGALINVDLSNYYPMYPGGSNGLLPNINGFGGFTDRYISYFGNAGYTLDKKYIFSLSGRVDKSNLFGVKTNQQAVPLYSTGIAWDISKEHFYPFSFLPYLKIRATYGYNGNVDKTVAAVTTIMRNNNSYITGQPFATILNPNNPQLQWEKTKMTNFGIDFASSSSIITGSMEYYKKRGINLIGYAPLSASTGIRQFKGNTASTKGEGVDLTFTLNLFRKRPVHWSSTINYSYSLDKVVKYDVQATSFDYLFYGMGSVTPFVGKPIFSTFAYRWAGLEHDNGDPQGYLNGEISKDYGAIISGTGLDDLVYLGSARPTSFGSFLNTVSYRSLSLSFNILYKFGYYLRRSSIDYGALFYNSKGHQDFSQRWQQSGDELRTNIPSIPEFPLNASRDNFYMLAEPLVSKADHIRLQDINLSYVLPTAKILGGKIKSAQIYFYANNVGILWRANKQGLDPDTFSSGLPTARTYALGLKCSL